MGPRLLSYSDVENAFDDPERIGRLAGLLQSLSGPDVVVTGSGDDTSPGVLPLVEDGRQALPFFDAVDTDVETFGNHDFDYGPDAARRIVAESPQQWVSANVREAGANSRDDGANVGDDAVDSALFAADAGVEPWTVQVVDGARVGFFGVTDPATASINPMATGLTFTDPMAAAVEAVDALRAEGVDYVVALSHLGSDDTELARTVDVDVVLGGHVHSERCEYVHSTLLTRPGNGGYVVWEVDLDGQDGPEATRHEVASGPLDTAVADELRRRKTATGLDEVVGRVETPIQRTEDVVFAGECRVGNLVTDAYRWATGADVTLQNSGGIRNGDPLAGAVTRADLIGLVPFEEAVVVAELTGEELRAVVQEATENDVTFDEDGWWHGHFSGIQATFSACGTLAKVAVGGEPLDTERTYTLATSDYLLHTDHEFPTLDERHRVAEYDIQYEVIVEYVRETGIDPAVDGRLVSAD